VATFQTRLARVCRTTNRYELSKFNGIRGDFFVGTFAANTLACFVDSVAYGINAARISPYNQKFAYLVTSAIGTGFGGCCSTVSTFMTDVIKLLPTSKDQPPTNAIRYVFVTFAVNCVVSLTVYQIFKIHFKA